MVAHAPAVDPDVADTEQAEDAERRVVDVGAAGRDVLERPDPVPDRVGDPAGGGKRRREPKRAPEATFTLGVIKVALVPGGQVVHDAQPTRGRVAVAPGTGS